MRARARARSATATQGVGRESSSSRRRARTYPAIAAPRIFPCALHLPGGGYHRAALLLLSSWNRFQCVSSSTRTSSLRDTSARRYYSRLTLNTRLSRGYSRFLSRSRENERASGEYVRRSVSESRDFMATPRPFRDRYRVGRRVYRCLLLNALERREKASGVSRAAGPSSGCPGSTL